MRLIAMLMLLAGVVTPTPPYRILVASESGDIVTELVWDGTRARVASIAVPRQPTGITILRTP